MAFFSLLFLVTFQALPCKWHWGKIRQKCVRGARVALSKYEKVTDYYYCLILITIEKSRAGKGGGREKSHSGDERSCNRTIIETYTEAFPSPTYLSVCLRETHVCVRMRRVHVRKKKRSFFWGGRSFFFLRISQLTLIMLKDFD